MDEEGVRQRQPGENGDDTEPLIHSTTRQPRQSPSFWEAIKNSIFLSLIGILLFCGGIGLQFWNEVCFTQYLLPIFLVRLIVTEK